MENDLLARQKLMVFRFKNWRFWTDWTAKFGHLSRQIVMVFGLKNLRFWTGSGQQNLKTCPDSYPAAHVRFRNKFPTHIWTANADSL